MKRLRLALLLCASLPPLMAAAQERGSLLVATEQITDEAFGQTVVLLLHYGGDGAFGVALNRPTWVSTREVFPDLRNLHGYRGRVFHGGPIAQATVLVLSRGRDGPGPDAEPLVEDVYLSSNLEQLEDQFDRTQDDTVLRFYAGHAGWGPSQLDEEIEAGAWRVVPATAALIFDAEPLSLWRRLTAAEGQMSVDGRLAPRTRSADGTQERARAFATLR